MRDINTLFFMFFSTLIIEVFWKRDCTQMKHFTIIPLFRKIHYSAVL